MLLTWALGSISRARWLTIWHGWARHLAAGLVNRSQAQVVRTTLRIGLLLSFQRGRLILPMTSDGVACSPYDQPNLSLAMVVEIPVFWLANHSRVLVAFARWLPVVSALDSHCLVAPAPMIRAASR